MGKAEQDEVRETLKRNYLNSLSDAKTPEERNLIKDTETRRKTAIGQRTSLSARAGAAARRVKKMTNG